MDTYYQPTEDEDNKEINHIINTLIKEDPSELSYCFCYCGCPASEHQDANKFCFNCSCMKFIPVEGEFV